MRISAVSHCGDLRLICSVLGLPSGKDKSTAQAPARAGEKVRPPACQTEGEAMRMRNAAKAYKLWRRVHLSV